MQPTFVPLRIPSGWMISYNEFRAVRPEQFTTDDYVHSWEFKEDIFQFENIQRHRIMKSHLMSMSSLVKSLIY